MQWPLFLGYAAVVWLIFVKLKLIRLTLPIALVLAAAGPLVFGYILYAMNFYHPGSSDVQVLRRVVQVAPRTSKPGRVTEVPVTANTPMKKGDLLFNIDATPFEFEVSRLQASLACLSAGCAGAEGRAGSGDRSTPACRRTICARATDL